MAQTHTDVLIVGAGPVGLFLANELLRHGLRCQIIDKKTGLSTHSKALGIHIRSLEMFADSGFIDKILQRGHAVKGMIFKHQQQDIAAITFEHTDAPYHHVIDLPQDETEAVLAEGLNQKDTAVLWQTELLRFEEHIDHIVATVQQPDQTEATLTASWLVACDGAHSTVRHLLNLDFLGSPYQEHWWLADLHIDWDLANDHMMVYLDHDGPMALFPMAQQRYRLVMIAPADGPETPTLSDVQQLFAKKCPQPARLRDPLWINGFNLQHRQIQQYRHSRVFLAGDAAHIHSPLGGQGMNTGLQDAYNLAWKLALTQRGLATERLLDSYHAERYPVGHRVLHETDRMTKAFTLKNPVAIQLRNQLMKFLTSFEVVKDKLANNMAELLVQYPHSPIVEQHGHLTVKTGQLLPYVHLQQPQGQTQHLFEVCQGTVHHLLLFSRTSNAEVHTAASHLYQEIQQRYPNLITVHWIGADQPQAWPGLHWLDPDHNAWHKIGAQGPCLLLTRPDQYLAYVQDSLDAKPLLDYLAKIFK